MSNLKELEFIKSKGLTQEFEEFKTQPIWSINKCDNGYLHLYKNKKHTGTVASSYYFKLYDFIHLVHIIATYMKCLATQEQLFNEYEKKYQIYYNNDLKIWDYCSQDRLIDSSYIIDTKENAQRIADILNNSKDLKEWMGIDNE